MTILKKRVGEDPVIQIVKNDLETMQTLVGGHIEAVPMPIKTGELRIYLICNDDGVLTGMPWNCRLFGQDYVGDIFFCAGKDSEFCSYPYDLKLSKVIFRELWGEYDG